MISLLILSLVLLFFKEIQAILYDREIALAVGLPEKQFYYLIVFILGVSIAVSMRMIGALLVDAFVLLPAMAAYIISKSLKQVFFFSSLFGLLSGMVGLYLSFLWDIPDQFRDHSGRLNDHCCLYTFKKEVGTSCKNPTGLK